MDDILDRVFPIGVPPLGCPHKWDTCYVPNCTGNFFYYQWCRKCNTTRPEP